MKLSKFNQIFQCNNLDYLYNSMSGALVELDEESLCLISEFTNTKISIERFPKETLTKMMDCGFLLSADIDEEAQYLNKRTQYVHSDTTLRIVVAPTLDCNFRCSYCYEKHDKPGMMTENIEDKIVSYVFTQIKKGKYRQLLVFWYGGEPLLGIKNIESLSGKIIKLCEDNKISYKSVMITNGYLLTNQNIKILKDAQVEKLQITIDGTPVTHGKRRILLSDKNSNTYYDIVKGINRACATGFRVDVRINIDYSNYMEIKNAIDTLAEVISDKENVRIYLGKIFLALDHENIRILDSSNFIESHIDCVSLCEKLGFRIINSDKLPSMRYCYCSAPYGNSIVVDPWGYVYSCWNDIGIDEYRVGQLMVDGRIKRTKKNRNERDKWTNACNVISKECQVCENLPLCGGGCVREKVHYDLPVVCDDKACNIQKFLIKLLKN